MGESLSGNYASGGFGKSLEPGPRPALLVVDFVQAYLVPGSPLYAGVESARDACRRLLGAAGILNLNRHRPTPAGATQR